MEEILQQILSEIKRLKSGQKEMKNIVIAVRHNQEITNAKLDALTLDVRKVQG